MNAAPKWGGASLTDVGKAKSSKSFPQLQKPNPTASAGQRLPRSYSQREIEHECWVLMGELDELRRYKERIAANRRRRR